MSSINNSLANSIDTLATVAYNIRNNTVVSSTNNTIVLDNGASAVDDQYNNKVIEVLKGKGRDQYKLINDYTGLTKTCNISTNWTTNPDSTSEYVIHQNSGSVSSSFNNNVTLNNSSSTDDFYNNAIIKFINNDGTINVYTVVDYDGTNNIVFLDQQISTQINNESVYIIYGESGTVSSATTNTVVLDGNQSSLIQSGMFIKIVNPNGLDEVKEIDSISTNTVTIIDNWSTIPSNGARYLLYSGWSSTVYDYVASYDQVTFKTIISDNFFFVLDDSLPNNSISYIKSDSFEKIILREIERLNLRIDIVSSVPLSGSINTIYYKSVNLTSSNQKQNNNFTASDNNFTTSDNSLTTIDNINFTYNINSRNFRSSTSNGANIITSNSVLSCTTSTSNNSVGEIISKRILTFNNSNNHIARFAAAFNPPVANSVQLVGVVSLGGSGIFFGYNSTQFGTMYRTDGRREVRVLTITAGANAAENATITLDGSVFVVSLVDVDSNTFATATDISKFDFSSAGFKTIQNGSTVQFVSTTLGSRNGTYSFVSGGTATSSGFVQETAGTTPIETWKYQDNWNGNRFNNSFEDAMVIDPSTFNNYEISYRTNIIIFRIFDNVRSKYLDANIISVNNRGSAPIIDNLSCSLAWIIDNGTSTEAMTLNGYSGSLCFEGNNLNSLFGNPFSVSAVINGTSILRPLTTLRNREILNGKSNTKIVSAIKVSVISIVEPVTLYVYLNSDLALNVGSNSIPNFEYVNENNSIVEVDTGSNSFTSVGQLVQSFSVVENTNFTENLIINNKPLEILPGDSITIAGSLISGNNRDISVSLSWIE